MTIAEKLTAIAENEQLVFDAGKRIQEQAFWEVYQGKGTRQDYSCAFGGIGWNNSNFTPRYDIIPTNAYMLFRGSLIEGDLIEIANNLGVTISLEEVTNIQNTFMNSAFTRVGCVNTQKSNDPSATFQNATKLKTIDKLILKTDGTQVFSNTFANAQALENITIEGIIGQNLNVRWSPLTHNSLMSIINHLQTKASGSFVLTLGTTNLGKLTDTEKAIATEKGWTLA